VGGFVGCLARNADLSDSVLRQAMAYGTALASFNVEEFGADRVLRLTSNEVHERVAELRRVTHFEEIALELT
jgi:hypothetical protein